MSLHNGLKEVKVSLEAVAIQGRALLSCGDVSMEQITAYKDLVDSLLIGAGTSLAEISQIKPKSAVGVSQESDDEDDEKDDDKKDDDDEGKSDDDKDESDDKDDDADESKEDDDEGKDDDDAKEDDSEEEHLDDKDLPTPEDAQLAVNEAEEHEGEAEPETDPEPAPAEELAEVVDKVDHVVEKVDIYISATEGSGLTTDDVQDMADVRDNFESITTMMTSLESVSSAPSPRLIKAYKRLQSITLKNLSKRN